jgi:hypothetical protein
LLRQLYATFSRRSREQLGSRDPLVGLAHPLWPAKEMRARHPFHANRPHVGFPTRSMTHIDPGYLVARVIRAMSDWLKFKNPEAPAVKREAEEDWGKDR